MTTATKTQTLPDVPADSKALDFDERLVLAGISISTAIDHKYGDVIRDAQAEAAACLEAEELLAPEPVTFEPNQVLATARRIIETRGWTKGAYDQPNGAVCAINAIRLVTRGDGWYHRPTPYTTEPEDTAMAELTNRIAADTGNTLTIPAWNDSRADKSEVLRLLY